MRQLYEDQDKTATSLIKHFSVETAKLVRPASGPTPAIWMCRLNITDGTWRAVYLGPAPNDAWSFMVWKEVRLCERLYRQAKAAYTDPEHRKKGYARAVLDAALWDELPLISDPDGLTFAAAQLWKSFAAKYGCVLDTDSCTVKSIPEEWSELWNSNTDCERDQLVLQVISCRPEQLLKQHGDELEMPQTPGGMQQIIDYFVESDELYPPAQRAAKRRVSKLIREEYVPLFSLVRCMASIETARLAKPSNHGPDAFLVKDQQEIALQVTTAGEDEETFLERKMLDEGRPVFPRMKTDRDPVTKSPQQSGRALEVRKERTLSLLAQATAAIQKKVENYREGTPLLLVSMRQSAMGQDDDWLARLHSELAKLGKVPYEAIYLCSNDQIFLCWPTCEAMPLIDAT